MATKAKMQMLFLDKKQKEIAAVGQFSEPYVSRCINGQQKPSQRLIDAAVKVTGLPASALFEVTCDD